MLGQVATCRVLSVSADGWPPRLLSVLMVSGLLRSCCEQLHESPPGFFCFQRVSREQSAIGRHASAPREPVSQRRTKQKSRLLLLPEYGRWSRRRNSVHLPEIPDTRHHQSQCIRHDQAGSPDAHSDGCNCARALTPDRRIDSRISGQR